MKFGVFENFYEKDRGSGHLTIYAFTIKITDWIEIVIYCNPRSFNKTRLTKNLIAKKISSGCNIEINHPQWTISSNDTFKLTLSFGELKDIFLKRESTNTFKIWKDIEKIIFENKKVETPRKNISISSDPFKYSKSGKRWKC